MTKTNTVAADYDKAGTSTSQGSGSFADDYDSADTSQAGDTSDQADADQSQDQAQDLDISAADVQKMQELKQSGDMSALGSYVANLLN